MTDKQGKTSYGGNGTDTRELLQGAAPEAGLDLESILAEYSGKKAAASEPSVPENEPVPAPLPEEDAELDSISPEEMFGLPGNSGSPVGDILPDEPEDDEGAEEEEGIPLTMEEVVASTVDAVKEEQERQQEEWRKSWEKKQKKERKKAHAPRKDPTPRPPLPELREPQMSEAAARQRRRYFECRRSLVAAVPVLLLLWLPWLLEQFGVDVPFFGESRDNAALCVLVPQAVLCSLCWPVFRAAVEDLRSGVCSGSLLAALCNIVTILDEVTMPFLAQRADTAPLGGVASAAMIFTLWGLTSWHKGLWETFRTAALGAPVYAVDSCVGGIAKGRGGVSGFYTRVTMEDTVTQWQRLLLPVLITASVVFAGLSSMGQGKVQDLLWCWSVTLCACCALVGPLAYFVPFGRLARRLAGSGAAVAGQYGAAALASSRQIVVTDVDLFPGANMSLSGLKLYGEERAHAVSYAASLAVLGGGILGRAFNELYRSERVALHEVDHFHIHEDCGLGGIIHGETVLLGSHVFMRHNAVKLPNPMPSRTCVCLAVDGQLVAVFSVKYNTSDLVESSLRALSRNGMQLTMAVRDGNITPKLLKTRFGTDGNAWYPECSERLALSDPERDAGGPNGLLYREGLYPFVELVSGSRRLCHVVKVGNLLSILSSISGVLLGFYLTFIGSYSVLTPLLLLTYLFLWTVPVLPLLWGVDKT